MNSAYKNCPKCKSNKVVKNGFQTGRIVYKCKNCSKKFQNKKINSRQYSSTINQPTFKKTIVI